jgi:hypothetical protein
MRYNDGYPCFVFEGKGGLSEQKGKLKYIIPHNPTPGKLIADIAEDELDRIISGRGVDRPSTHSPSKAVKLLVRRH